MNYMKMEIPARSENESFVRVVVAAFAARLDPTLEELNEVKTAVSEAVTNCIIHAYDNIEEGIIMITVSLDGNKLSLEIEDYGKGIMDIEQAREPLYTEKPELERAGMGFSIMENFMDELFVESVPGKGTRVTMIRTLGKKHTWDSH
ncbi:MAG TPA: anti-sigma F factor [Firmicutes bacterium]|nr:anti-sigma F factor [Bacillota bacterium]